MSEHPSERQQADSAQPNLGDERSREEQVS